MISFVVYTAGCITSYSVNMVRWAGRASLVIMNQEEKVLNTDTNDGGQGVSMKNTALGDAKLHKFTLLVKATLINLFETHSPSPKFRAFKVMVTGLNKFLVKIWTIAMKKSLQKINPTLKYFNAYSCTTTLFLKKVKVLMLLVCCILVGL